MPEVCIDHTNDAVERHPSLLVTRCCGCRAQAIGVIMLAAGNAHRSGGGENYLAPPRNARIWSMRSTTQARSCAFSASSRSSGLWLLRLETCPFGLPLGCRAWSRAISRLSTFFILFDREISFMNHPPGTSTVG